MFLARGLCYIDQHRLDPDRQTRSVTALAQTTDPLPGGLFLSLERGHRAVVVLVGRRTSCTTPASGRNVYAIGGNEQSALLMGLPVGRTKIAVYAVSGFCSALGGVLLTFYMLSGYGAARPRHGARRDRGRRHRRDAADRRLRLTCSAPCSACSCSA